jgi:glycosyltransferase involved in cell wall biosynthesis
MDAVRQQGWPVTVFAIHRERHEIRQPGAAHYEASMSSVSDLRPKTAASAQWRLFRARPRTLAAMWWRAIRGNARSPKFLVRAVVVAWGTPALAERVDADGIRHLHAHWGTHSALLAHLIALVTGVPYSITLHAHDLHVDRTMLATKLRSATDVVTISEHNAEMIRREYPFAADRTQVVHCGVDLDQLPARSQLGRDTVDDGSRSLPRIACVAGLRDFKGHTHLLEAARLLDQRGVDAAYDLVGDGSLRADLEQQSTSNVTFHGALDVEQALDIVRVATLFVMPSVELANGRRDGIPVALMEAMAIGVPVVTTRVSGIPELVTDDESGVLVRSGDAVALADAIDSLLGDAPRQARLSRYARRVVEREFDIVMTGEAMSKIFRASINNKAGQK